MNGSLLFLPALLLLAGPASGDVRFLQGMGDVRYHRVDSRITDQRYHVFVRLPEGYAATEERYPTVYLLDGGWSFPLVSGYYRYLHAGNEIPAAILVGLSYGTDDFREGNHRSTDYTAPSDEREHWGGAERFRKALAEEILPLIEDNYRSDTNRRVLFGQSIGAQFVLFSAMTRPDLFWGHIASNPALHRNLPFFLQRHDERGTASSSRLFVGSGSDDEPQFRGPAQEWIRHWLAEGGLPVTLCAAELSGHSHFSAPPAAFRDGMRWLFESGAGVSCRTAAGSSGSGPPGSLPR